MTNKPMLSVERELLEELRNVCGDPDLAAEANAILDKPVVERDERADFEKEVQGKAERFQPDFRKHGLHPGAEYKCANNQWAWELWQKRASTGTPAAQHQGEPVAVKVSWADVEPWYNESEQMLRDVCKFEGLKGVALEVWRAARLNEVKP